jgi:alanyl-tRNA synthetase
MQKDLARLAGIDVDKLQAREKALEHEVQQLKTRMAQSQSRDLESQARDLNGVKVLAVRVDGFDRGQLRTLVDSLRNKWKSAVVVLASAEDSNVSIVGRRYEGSDREGPGRETGGRESRRPSAARAAGGRTWPRQVGKIHRHWLEHWSRFIPPSRGCSPSPMKLVQ